MEKIIPEIKLGKYKEEKIEISLSAFEVFKRFHPYCQNIFLLESLGEEGKFNRFSYIGFDPSFVISAVGNEIIINNRLQKVGNPYKVISEFSRFKSDGENYCGGLVGFVSHEGTKYFEPAFSGFKNNDFPDFAFGFYQDGLKFDKRGGHLIYFHHGQSRLSKVLQLVNRSGRLSSFSFKPLSSGKDEKDHRKMVLEAQKLIRAGDIFQVVLSLKSHFQVDGDYRRIYAVLRHINPSPYMVYMKFGEREVITASPELLIRVKGRKIEHFGTLAGTIKRGKNTKEDELLAKSLTLDEKEMAEHMMLVDLARNDLGKICEFGSVKVDKLHTVKKYSHVQHLYSEVRGMLKAKENNYTALAACFPAGTLTGAPKIEAMKIIRKLEGEPRGPYGGTVGYFSLNSESMLAITIRSLFINGDNAYTQTGSGIVLDSDPQKEFGEIINKQKAMEEALELAAM